MHIIQLFFEVVVHDLFKKRRTPLSRNIKAILYSRLAGIFGVLTDLKIFNRRLDTTNYIGRRLFCKKKRRKTRLLSCFPLREKPREKCHWSVFLAILGELFGIAPFLVVAVLASRLYAGTATVGEAAILSAGAAVGMAMRAFSMYQILHAKP